MAKATHLKNLRLSEISLVDDPANPGARVVLAKRAGAVKVIEKSGAFEVTDGVKVLATAKSKEAADGLLVILKETLQRFEGGVPGYPVKIEALGKLVAAGFDPSASCAIVGLPVIPYKEQQPDLRIDEDDQGGGFMKGLAELVKLFMKSGKSKEDTVIDKSKLDEGTKAYIESLEKDKATAEAAAKKAQEDAVAKANKEADERVAKAQKEAEEAKKLAQEEKDQRLTKSYQDEVVTFKRLGLDKSKDHAVLRELDEKCSEETRKRIREILKSADASLAKAAVLQTQIGSDNGDEGDVDVVKQVTVAIAEKIAKNAKLSEAVAMGQVFAEHPEWYAEYRSATSIKV